MSLLKTILKRLFQGTLLVLLLLASLWGISRALYPTDAQREAVAELERWPEYPGDNAFPLLWTLDRDVPDEELARVLAEDVRTVTRQQAEALATGELPGAFAFDEDLPSAAYAYPTLRPDDADRELFCGGLEADCLQRVRDDLEAYAALVQRHARLLDRVERLQEFDYVRSAFPPHLSSPWPRYDLARLTQTRNAVHFAQGRTSEAVAATCRDLLTWRRLGARSDGLIPRMFGITIAGRDGGQLLASMLAELPVDEPLPAPCGEALALPTEEELSLCNAMRGEFALHAELARTGYAEPDRSLLDQWTWWLLVDPEASMGKRAEGWLTLCPAPESDEALERRLETLRNKHQSVGRLECVGNLFTCSLDALSILPYSDYMQRVQDHGARLRALATLAWMRSEAGDGRTPAERLAARPAELNVPADEMRIGPDGRTLQIQLRWTRRGETWSIPLPPVLHADP
ncbi:MAG: hypothetical protein V2I57_07965 [Xanthomonadales bacterium]|jgi:hypothetical protein|nr:hypothetical protein [Xanthomonadales bacterium]